MWPLVALLVGAGAMAAPVPTLLGLLAVAALAVALFAPRLTAGLAVLAILFVRPLAQLVPVPAVSYLDETLVALCVVTLPLRRLLDRKPLRTFPGQWWFVAFLTVGLLSSLIAQVPFVIFLTGTYIIGKGLLLAWAVAQLDWSDRHLLRATRATTVVILLSFVAMAVNLAFPGAWNAVLASDKNAVAPRSFLPSLIGPFTHPIDLGQFMALSAIAITTWRSSVRKTGLTLALLLGTVAGAALTGRRTAAVGLSVAWLWLQRLQHSVRVLVALVACVPIAIVVLGSSAAEVVQATYQDYIGAGEPEARTVLTVDSFSVAAEHFPAGAGFGRFGSATAAENYSPEYVARGYPHVWGLGRGKDDGRFLTDTEWPAILGETGYLGAIAFALGLAGIYRAGRRLSRNGHALTRWAGFTVIGWLVVLVLQSVGTVAFTGPPVYGAFFALVGICAALSDRAAQPAAP
ncbi:MAG TPA: hypothetical protein VGE11_01595 [Pseudonocardia sp.]